MIRAAWVPCDDEEHSTGRRTFDPDGWQETWLDDPEQLDKERPRLYPIWHTTPDELAIIGGPGVRLYFALLGLISKVFFLLAVIMTVPIGINLYGDMYQMPEASDFVLEDYNDDKTAVSLFDRTLWARTTLGAHTRCNVTQQRMSNNFGACESPEGESGSTDTLLIVYACVELLAAFIVLMIVKKVNDKKAELDELSDAAMVSMSDYTVQLRPREGFWRLPEKADPPIGRQQAFKESLCAHVEKHLGKVARVPSEETGQSELGIWLAFPEEQRIAYWRQKVALLKRLEDALAHLDGTHVIGCGRNKATAVVETSVKPHVPPSADTVTFPSKTVSLATKVSKVVLELEKLNEKLAGEEKHNEVVCAFVTFEDERDQDKACDLVAKPKARASAVHPEVDGGQDTLHFNGRDFKIREAPEPDTLLFTHLQYSARSRNKRRGIAILALIVVLVGFMAVTLEVRNLVTDTAFDTVCPNIEWDPSSDYAICDGAYDGNFSIEAQTHYKTRWQYVWDAVGTQLPRVAEIDLASSMRNETAQCMLHQDRADDKFVTGCCEQQDRTWAAAARESCTRVWTVDADLSLFPTTRGDGLTGLRQCDVDRDCEAEPLEPGLQPRPLCSTMQCSTSAAGADWEDNLHVDAPEWECVGGLDQPCDNTDRLDLERCCSKSLKVDMTRGHSVEAVCYHCICDCLVQTDYNDYYNDGVESDEYGRCPEPAGGWTEELIATYCAGDGGWDEWDRSVSWRSRLSSVITTFLNQVLKAGLEATSDYEKAHTQAMEQSSLAIKVAMAQFTNTVLLWMISTMYFEWVSFSTVYPTDGLSPWANARWYYQVGTPFMLTMFINQCLPPAIHAAKYWTFRWLQRMKLNKCSCGARTQNRLNHIYEFQEWKLASSYGEVLFVLTSTLLLCTALPMLLWISAFGMSLKYWSDKSAVLRCYRKPPLYSSDLFEQLDVKLYFILAMHLMSATYFLAAAGGETPNEAYSPSSVKERQISFLLDFEMLTQRHVLPLWLSALVIVSFPVFKISYTAYMGKEHRVAQARKKKLDGVHQRCKQARYAAIEALKRRHSLTDADTEHLEDLLREGDRDGRQGLKEAVSTVLQKRETASQDSSSAEDKNRVDHNSAREGMDSRNRLLSGTIAQKTSNFIDGAKNVASMADAIIHKSPVGKITDAVGHAGKTAAHTTSTGLALAGKGLKKAAAGGGAVADKIASSGKELYNETVKAATRALKLGRSLNADELDKLDDDDFIDAVSKSIFGLAGNDFLSDRQVDDPDAKLPSFSVAHEGELLVNTHDHYNMEAASVLLELQRSFRDTLYEFDKRAADRLQPVFASVRKEDAGGETMTMQRISLAIGMVDPRNGQPLTNTELLYRLRPDVSEHSLRRDPRRGGILAPIAQKKPIFMAP